MDDYAEIPQLPIGFRPLCAQQLVRFRKVQAARDDALGVVVATDGDEGDRGRGAGEASELGDEELAGAPVLPLTVIEIAGGHDEGDVLRDGMVDQRDEGVARGGSDARGWRVGVGLEPAQRAVDVQVGAMEEAEGGHGWSERDRMESRQ
jgi:hypothetical protein